MKPTIALSLAALLAPFALFASIQNGPGDEPGYGSPRLYYAAGPDDQASDLVDQLRYRTLREMWDAKLHSATLAEQPWSDDYWPVYQGGLARRYTDPHFPRTKDWKANTQYILKNLGATGSDASSLEQLSPAEKYDLLVGDPRWTLSRAMVETGRAEYAANGKVETWAGICHGWAPASFMVPRPTRSVDVLAADGRTRLHFYPADIKALVSLLWANAPVPTRLVSGRCEDKKPRLDADGRPVDTACLDTNAGTWHLAVVNQLGHSRRGLVMDRSGAQEVWNQPIFSYSYRLFDPRTGKPVSRFEEALAPVSELPRDPYRKYRSPQAASIAQVEMQVSYVNETTPIARDTDGPEDDSTQRARYTYDLEIDASGNIVGGEWISGEHPDFLWAPSPQARPRTRGDLRLDRLPGREAWDGSRALPADWRRVAAETAREGLPLAHIVEALVALSRAGL